MLYYLYKSSCYCEQCGLRLLSDSIDVGEYMVDDLRPVFPTPLICGARNGHPVFGPFKCSEAIARWPVYCAEGENCINSVETIDDDSVGVPLPFPLSPSAIRQLVDDMRAMPDRWFVPVLRAVYGDIR